MTEKISDKSIREDKVKKLKTKILKEIDEKSNRIKAEIDDSEEFEEFEFLNSLLFALFKLKRYIENEYTFMSYEAQYLDMDIIIYTISDKNLDIWLQEDYYFVGNFLLQAEENGFNIFPLLNDHHFGYHFTNIFDDIVYDEKIEKQKI